MKHIARWLEWVSWKLSNLAAHVNEGEATRIAEEQYQSVVRADRKKTDGTV